jgi:hypothetical protein
MTGTVPWIKDGPETYEVNVTVDGGQLVMPDTGGKIKPTDTAGVITSWLGVALYRAEPAATTGEDTVYGYPRVGYDVPRPEVAVGTKGIFKLLAAEALNFGDIVYPGTLGRVQKTTATGRQVGIVVETGGIANGARGKVRLFQ